MTFETLTDFGLDGVNCELCGNTGTVTTQKDGILYSKECKCMAERRLIRNIKRSGMTDMLNRYTFDSYTTPDEKRLQIKRKATDFVRCKTGWFFIGGRSGSGKTHVCTAICMELAKQGNNVQYMMWRDKIVELKASVNTETYQEEIKKLKTVDALYIDDFLKGNITEADLNIAFELLNARYNDSKLRTVISSELQIQQIAELSEAIAGRIVERANGFLISSPDENWRLK